MSRCTIQSKNPDVNLVVGFDPPLQSYFGQAWAANPENEEEEEVPIDQLWEGSHGELLEWLEKWQPDLDDPRTKEVYNSIAMDLDPGTGKPYQPSQARIISFGSAEEMMDYIEQGNAEAKQNMVSWQEAVKEGDYIVRGMPELGLIVYAQVVERELSPDPDERAYEEETIKRSHANGYRFCRAYSAACPEGELGDIHVSVMDATISQAAFEAAQQAGWPCDPAELEKVVHRMQTSN
jgi:hypothetical protein